MLKGIFIILLIGALALFGHLVHWFIHGKFKDENFTRFEAVYTGLLFLFFLTSLGIIFTGEFEGGFGIFAIAYAVIYIVVLIHKKREAKKSKDENEM